MDFVEFDLHHRARGAYAEDAHLECITCGERVDTSGPHILARRLSRKLDDRDAFVGVFHDHSACDPLVEPSGIRQIPQPVASSNDAQFDRVVRSSPAASANRARQR